MKRYFTAAGLFDSNAEQSAQMNAIAQALMQGRASKWLDRLERLGIAPTNFTDFAAKFLEQFSVLDNENTARDKLRMA